MVALVARGDEKPVIEQAVLMAEKFNAQLVAISPKVLLESPSQRKSYAADLRNMVLNTLWMNLKSSSQIVIISPKRFMTISVILIC